MACNQSTSFECQSSREPGTDNNNPATISTQSFEKMLNTENSQISEDTPPKGQNESSKEDTVKVGNLDVFNAKEKSIHYEPGKFPNEIIPNEASLNSHPQAQPNIEPKPPSPKDIATLLAGTDIIDSTKYGSCEVGRTDPPHLRVVPGLNILAVCRNVDCKFHLKDVMCPKGISPENNGYCPFDKEIHKVHCPVCKQRIKVDNSFGYCFYQCKVEIRYMLDDNNSGKLNIEASNNELLFAKCSNSISGHLQYLELQFLN